MSDYFFLSAENFAVINQKLMVSVKKTPVLHLLRNNKTQQKSRPVQDKINMDAVSAVLVVFQQLSTNAVNTRGGPSVANSSKF